jgi:hypothetical protein
MKTDNSKNNYTGLVIATGTVGSITGGIYGAKNISEARVKKIAETNIDNVKYFDDLADCIDIEAAKGKTTTGALNQEEFNLVSNVKKTFKQFVSDESFLKKVVQTPIKERTISYTDAVKIANISRREAWKANLKIKRDLTQKLVENGILDGKKWQNLVHEQVKKTVATYKIMATPILIGIAAGAGIGTLIGLGIKSLLNNNKNN